MKIDIKYLVEKLENISGKEVVLERDSKTVYEYGCVMLYFDCKEISDLHNQIDPLDVYKYGDKRYGIESEEHVTLLCGFHVNETTSEEVFDFLKQYKFPKLYLYNISVFKNEEYDILKLECRQDVGKGKYIKEDDLLFKINSDLRNNFKHTNNYTEYKPHVTVAYLKPGMGKKYVEKFKDFYCLGVVPEKLVYSKPTENKQQTETITYNLNPNIFYFNN